MIDSRDRSNFLIVKKYINQVIEQMDLTCVKVAKTVFGFFIPLLFTLMLSQGAYAKEQIGWIENVSVTPGDVSITAKIDTGADSSSLHCDCIDVFLRDGKRWVRFSITSIDGKQATIEKKVIRTVKVKGHFGDSKRRDVVRLGLCIGDQYEETDVSLVDRSGFKYNMLIGRKYLQDKFVIDPSQQFTVEPHCVDAK